MADGPFTAGVRSTLLQLQRLCADRASREAGIAQAHAEATARVGAAWEAARAAAIQADQQAEGAARAQVEAARSAATSQAQQALDELIRSTEAQKNQVKEAARDTAAKAKRRVDETVWMAETLFDSNKDKPRQAQQAAMQELAARQAELTKAGAFANDFLARSYLPRIPRAAAGAGAAGEAGPPATPATPGTSSTPGTPGLAATPAPVAPAVPYSDQFKDLAARAQSVLDGLGRLRSASLLAGINPIATLAVFASGGAALAAWRAGWQWQPEPLTWGGGLGAGAGVLVLLGVYLRCRAVARRLGAEFAAIQATAQELDPQWRALAVSQREAWERAIKEKRDREIASGKEKYEQAISGAEQAANEKLDALRAKRVAGEHAIVAARAVALAEASERFDAAQSEREQRRRAALARADAERAAAQAEADERRQRDDEQLRHDWFGGMLGATGGVGGTAADAGAGAGAALPAGGVLGRIAGWSRRLAEQTPPWGDRFWDRSPSLDGAAGAEAAAIGRRWSPSSAQQPPTVFPLGAVSLSIGALPGGLSARADLALPAWSGFNPAQPVQLPCALELPERCSLLVQAPADGRAAALAALQQAMLRLLTALPPGKCRFTVCDPVGLGQSFAGFMHLADHDPLLIGDRIWTEPRHIEQRLTDLTEHMETVIQKYLRNQFGSIEEYNVAAGEVAEPYRFLVVADLPANLTEAAAKRLLSILTSGPRCGVYTLLHVDPRANLPTGLTLADLDRAVGAAKAQAATSAGRGGGAPAGDGADAGTPGGVKLAWKRTADGTPGLVWEDPDFAAFPLRVGPPPEEARANALIDMVGAASKDVGRTRVPFGMVSPAGTGAWTHSTADLFRVPLGRAGATKLQHLTLGKGTAQHALIAGRTGSGKSTLLHVIITAAALWHDPSQVELYLIDFKKGVEFKTYAAHALPHARVIAIESEREFGLSVLRQLDAELKRRGELFRAASVQDLAGFRAAQPGTPSPRILLLVDEFQELFVEDDKLAQEAGLLLDRLVRQGRAFGMHVVLGSQTLGGAYTLAKATIGQMAVRIALACSEQDAFLIMGDDNAAPRLLSRPGEAIYNDQSGSLEGNSPFQVAWLDEAERDAALDRVSVLQAAGRTVGPVEAERPATIVFEGSAPADVRRNAPLASVVALAGRGAGLDAARGGAGVSAGAMKVGTSPTLWLGEPIAIKEPTCVALRRQSGANVLVVGQRDQAALAMTALSIVAGAAQAAALGAAHHAGALPTGLAPVLVLDGTPADEQMAGTLGRVAAGLPGLARAVEYRQVESTLAALAAEVDARLAALDDTPRGETSLAPDGAVEASTLPPAAARPAITLIIHGVQRFRALRRPEDEFDFTASAGDTPRPDKLLARIVREGPAVGVHTVVWADTLASFNRVFDRSMLREFDSRVLFQMSAADSSALIDSALAGTIGANRALLFSEEKGVVEKFRPYALPDAAWLAAACERVVGAAGAVPRTH